MDQPLVSVITVTYNSAQYVRDAIESVLSQDYPNIEYIIGDDHSSDHTWNIIKEFDDTRIKLYRNEKNMGEYPNRNKAINLSRGKYIIFIDGDDYIYPHGISYFTRMIESYPDVAFAVQKGYTNNILYPVVLNSAMLLENYFFGKTSLLSSSFASDFFRADYLKQNGGLSEKYKTGDDEIRLRLASKYPVLFIAGWVTWPRETPHQASSTLNDGTSLAEKVMIIQDLINQGLISGKSFQENLIKNSKSQISRFIVRSLLRGKFYRIRAILKNTKFDLLDIIRYLPYKHEFADDLQKHTPAKPLKK